MGYRSVIREDYFYSQLTSLTKQEFLVDIKISLPYNVWCITSVHYSIFVNVFWIDRNMKFSHYVCVICFNGLVGWKPLWGQYCYVWVRTVPVFVSFARAHVISLVLCHCACSPCNKDHLRLLPLSKATSKIGGGHAKVCTVTNYCQFCVFVFVGFTNTDLSLSLSFFSTHLEFV